MALPDDVQIALTLLQVTGLVLPIVFIALRPFYAPGSKREVVREEQQTRQTGDDVEFPGMEELLVEFWASADEYWDAAGGDPPRPY